MGQREDTIIVFSSDNGAINDSPLHGTDKYPGWQEAYPRLGSNLPFRGVKAQLYEGGIRTPTLVNWRGHLDAATMDHPVQVTDWMPTFTNLVGAAPAADPRYDGRDIWPLITGAQRSPEPRRFFWNFRGDAHLGVREGDWKLIVRQADGGRHYELFNIAEDPYEETDRADELPDKVRQLEAAIEEERRQDGTSARTDVHSPGVN